MSTRTTIVTVFVLGFICGVLIALMWAERNSPDDRDTTRAEWRRPVTAKRPA